MVHTGDEYSNVIGKKGIAIKDINHFGYMNIAGELWKVEVINPVRKGDQLQVKAVNGLKLKAEKVI